MFKLIGTHMYKFFFFLVFCFSFALRAEAFNATNVKFEILINKTTVENDSELLFTLFQVQPKSQGIPRERVGAAIRMMRDGTIKAIRTFPKAIVFDLKRQSNGAYTYQIENGFLSQCRGFNHVVIETDENLDYQTQYKALELTHTNKHDFDILPNGNYLSNSYEPRRSTMGTNFKRANNCLQDAVVQERTLEGNIVFEWHGLEFYNADQTFYKRERGDYLHLNSTDLSPDGKHFLFSLFGISQVAIVSRANAKIIGRLGNRGRFEFIDDPLNGFCGQHQVEWTANNRILLFDNGNPERCGKTTAKRNYSRVVEYELNFELKTAKLIWSYERKDIHGTIAGGVSRLKNGNTLIAWGRHVKNIETAPTFTEVTSKGEVVWEARAKFDYKKLERKRQTPRSYRIYAIEE